MALIPEALRLDSPKVMDSTGALELETVPERLLVVGGGYIGLELGTVYAALGARVTVVEMTSSLLPGVDPELVRPLAQRLEHDCDAVLLDTRVAHLRETADGVAATLVGPAGEQEREFERVLVASAGGRRRASWGSNTRARSSTLTASSSRTSSGAPPSLRSSRSATSPVSRCSRTRRRTRRAWRSRRSPAGRRRSTRWRYPP